MYSKEESSKLREEFWTSFGKSFSRKWILYRTGVKEILFKFYFDTKKAMVCIDIEGKEISRIWIEKKDVCIHNKATWQETMEFFVSNMSQIELFWQEYEDLFKEDVF